MRENAIKVNQRFLQLVGFGVFSPVVDLSREVDRSGPVDIMSLSSTDVFHRCDAETLELRWCALIQQSPHLGCYNTLPRPDLLCLSLRRPARNHCAQTNFYGYSHSSFFGIYGFYSKLRSHDGFI